VFWSVRAFSASFNHPLTCNETASLSRRAKGSTNSFCLGSDSWGGVQRLRSLSVARLRLADIDRHVTLRPVGRLLYPTIMRAPAYVRYSTLCIDRKKTTNFPQTWCSERWGAMGKVKRILPAQFIEEQGRTRESRADLSLVPLHQKAYNVNSYRAPDYACCLRRPDRPKR
jgi:hypothetical protein